MGCAYFLSPLYHSPLMKSPSFFGERCCCAFVVASAASAAAHRRHTGVTARFEPLISSQLYWFFFKNDAGLSNTAFVCLLAMLMGARHCSLAFIYDVTKEPLGCVFHLDFARWHSYWGAIHFLANL